MQPTEQTTHDPPRRRSPSHTADGPARGPLRKHVNISRTPSICGATARRVASYSPGWRWFGFEMRGVWLQRFGRRFAMAPFRLRTC
jgi:hypothetical protein